MKITRVEALQIETLGYYEHLSGHVLVKVHAKTVNQAVDFFEVLHALPFGVQRLSSPAAMERSGIDVWCSVISWFHLRVRKLLMEIAFAGNILLLQP